MNPSLETILDRYQLISLPALFKSVLEYSQKNLGCQAGAAFVFDRPTGRLKLKATTWQKEDRHFSLLPGQGLAGKGFKTDRPPYVSDSKESYLEAFVTRPFFPVKEIRFGVAMPVSVDGQVQASFCFYFGLLEDRENHKYNRIDEDKAIQRLWEEFKSPRLGRAIQRIQMHGIPGRIHKAGQATARLTTEVSSFMSKLQEVFDKRGWKPPNMIYVQIKDASRRLIQTVQGFSDHQKLQVSSSHLLRSYDINADIVRTRCVEMISGQDPVRFDPAVFKDHGHEEYSRIWIPLFPFPMGVLADGSLPGVRERLAEIMKWEDPRQEDFHNQKGGWKEGYCPPEEIVYGVLEIGYRLDNPDQLTLDPWTPEFAMDVMAVAYERSVPLFRSTLPGVMDRIGRLLASTPSPCTVEFDCLFPNKGRQERRCYPMDTLWPVALPRSGKGTAPTEPCSPSDPKYQYEKPPVFIRFFPKNEFSLSMEEIWEQNATAAREAVKTAFKLYDAVMAPIMLIERNVKKDNVGTFIKDPAVENLIEDAVRSSGAEYGAFFSFETVRDAQGKCGTISAPPVEWRENSRQFQKDKIEACAQKAADEQSPLYPPDTFGLPACFLPLKLKEGGIGVIVLGFGQDRSFESGTKMDFGRQVLLWRHRLLLHRLILRKRFTNLMMGCRGDIVTARKEAVNNRSSLKPMETFTKKLLSAVTDRLAVNAALLSLYTPPKTGPSRLRLFWAETAKVSCSFEFFNIETQTSSQIFSGRDQVDILDGETLENCRKDTGQFLVEYQSSLGQKNQPECLEVLAGLLELCQDPKTRSILILPIQGDSSRLQRDGRGSSENIRGWFYLFMKERHFFARIHKRLAKELGQLVGQTMAQVREIQAEREIKALTRKADSRIDAFEKAKSIEEVIRAFLKGLGKPPATRSGNREEEYFNIAEDAIIWTYSLDRKEFVARSGRGSALDALNQSSKDIIMAEEHPFLSNLHFPNKNYPKLKGEFRFKTFDLDRIKPSDNSFPLCQAYKQKTGRRWLVSFPMVDPTDKIFGAFDLLRDTPLPTETEIVLEQVFLRISRRLNSAAEKVRLRQVSGITEALFNKAKSCIERAKTFPVYNDLAQILRSTFKCRQCDIFIERHDKYYLCGSTHPSAPKDERQRALHWFEKMKVQGDAYDRAEVFDRALDNGRPSIAHKWTSKIPMTHFSPDLKKFLGRANHPERMILPLKAMDKSPKNGPKNIHVDGLVQLHSPEMLRPEDRSEPLKKSQLFSAEDTLLGRDIGLQFRRIIQMLQLAEQQIWLVNETAHSVAQPLQVMYSDMNHLIRVLMGADISPQKVRALAHETGQSYEMIHEAINQLSYFTGINRSEWEYQKGDLTHLLIECCDFMAKPARLRNLHIDYSRVEKIPPLPMERAWMRKAILNLLHNACKYSWKGRRIDVSLQEYSGGILLEVVNVGIGIPQADEDKIFNAYFRSLVDDSHGVRPGTGIGLSIVKNVIETIHQGEIKGSSKLVQDTGEPSEKADRIKNRLHKTSFKATLNRNTLNNL